MTETLESQNKLEEIYTQMKEIWEKLCKLYSKRRRKPPILVMPNKAIRYDKESLKTVEFYPEPSEKRMNRILSGVHFYEKWFYLPDCHAIIVGDTSDPKFNEKLIHEATHSVMKYKGKAIGRIHISLDELSQLHYGSYAIGKEICKRIKDVDFSKGFVIQVGEFFVPLSLSYLGHDYKEVDWKNDVKIINGTVKERVLNLITRHKPHPLEKIMYTNTIVDHLPQLAGEILVDRYDRDVEKILKEHPDLPKLTQEELWTKHCRKILSPAF